jgi:hypothetical protein
MNRKLLLILSLFFALFAISAAQPAVDAQMAKESTEITANMHKVELLNELLPLALQPNQIQQILPALERIRSKQTKQLAKEHEALIEFQKSSAAAVDAGVKGKLPDPNYVRDIEVFYKAIDIGRQVATGENIDLLMPTLTKILDKGQQKVMANSLTLRFFEPDITAAEATDDQKIRVFCREILLDPMTYDLLVAMGK